MNLQCRYLVTLVLSAVLSIATPYSIRLSTGVQVNVLTAQPRDVLQTSSESVEILISKQHIGAGEPLAAEQFEKVLGPTSRLLRAMRAEDIKEFATDVEQLKGKFSVREIWEGDPVLLSGLSTVGRPFEPLTGPPPGFTFMQLSVAEDVVKSLAVVPGSRVDVNLERPAGVNGFPAGKRMIIPSVTVVKVEEGADGRKPGGTDSAPVMLKLLVPADYVERVELARNEGTLRIGRPDATAAAIAPGYGALTLDFVPSTFTKADVKSGDLVDVWWLPKGHESKGYSLITSKVKVIEIAAPSRGSVAAGQLRSVTLMPTADDLAKIKLAKDNGTIALTPTGVPLGNGPVG